MPESGQRSNGSRLTHDIGLVPLDTEGKWIGGRYYLQHLIKAVASLPLDERVRMSDVWWQEPAAEDPFAEVRSLLARRVVVRTPTSIAARAQRKLRRLAKGVDDARDLFLDAGIGALFPVLPCELPGIPYVFWLPDFQYLHMPELFGDKLCRWYEEHYTENVSLANLTVLSSRHASRDFERVFPDRVSTARIVNFCSIPDATWWRLDPLAVAAAKGLDGPFFLVSNQFSHHKNHGVVFEAMRILKDRGLDVRLVCTGSTYGFRGDDYFGGLSAFIDKHDLKSAILIVGMLPRDEQVALMRRSIAMLQPSRFEGWSTVVEDAKTLGKTLLVSGIEVHREQLGPDYDLYLDADDPEAWADAMSQMWSSRTPGPHYDDETRGLGFIGVSAQETGRSFVSVMREVMANA
ncbi:MAG TPA: glycosyltransferase [Blastocatellia bacterium]|nr:glycosyltransferase [Blastocatellia bacterium]